jgi:hypothetical protein
MSKTERYYICTLTTGLQYYFLLYSLIINKIHSFKFSVLEIVYDLYHVIIKKWFTF